MRKPAWLLSLLFIVAITAACGNSGKSDGQAGATLEVPVPSPTQTAEPAKKQAEVSVFYTNEELSDVIEQKTSIAYDSEIELIKSTLTALQTEPTVQAVSLWKPITIKSVELTEGLVSIDVHLPDEARLGAPGEARVIETLEQTLFQFDFVQSFELLVDGEKMDSLMGHVELEFPFNRTNE
ncbi:MAG: GerMN domain-containing protein [Candidatus Pristimantibacillus sp.]